MSSSSPQPRVGLSTRPDTSWQFGLWIVLGVAWVAACFVVAAKYESYGNDRATARTVVFLERNLRMEEIQRWDTALGILSGGSLLYAAVGLSLFWKHGGCAVLSIGGGVVVLCQLAALDAQPFSL